MRTREDLKNIAPIVKQFVSDKLDNLPTHTEMIIQNTKLNNFSVSTIDVLSGNIHKGNVCVAGDAFHPMTPT